MTPREATNKALDAGKRLPELEHIIMTCSYESYRYARYVIKGELPNKMHNTMLLYAIEDPNNIWVKSYFWVKSRTYHSC